MSHRERKGKGKNEADERDDQTEGKGKRGGNPRGSRGQEDSIQAVLCFREPIVNAAAVVFLSGGTRFSLVEMGERRPCPVPGCSRWPPFQLGDRRVSWGSRFTSSAASRRGPRLVRACLSTLLAGPQLSSIVGGSSSAKHRLVLLLCSAMQCCAEDNVHRIFLHLFVAETWFQRQRPATRRRWTERASLAFDVTPFAAGHSLLSLPQPRRS